jgi:tRNA-dihydrouridine synthase A
MMKRTFPAHRQLLRRLTRHTLLVTEMVNVRALQHGDRDAVLPQAQDGPVSAQLGGVELGPLVAAARFAVDRGYDEVDLNCGCPSDRATDSDVGACLMREPERVAEAVAAVVAAVEVPVTVKCRIGVVDRPVDDWGAHEATVRTIDDLARFVDLSTAAGAARVAVHARVAVLEGLDPRANRRVPPLRHDEVHELAATRPDVVWQCNGGVRTLDEVLDHLVHVDGVLVGRAAWDDPLLFAAADRVVFGDASRPDPGVREVLEDVLPRWEVEGDRPGAIDLRNLEGLAGLWHGRPGAKHFRHGLAELRARGDVTAGDVLALLAAREAAGGVPA